MKKIFVKNLIGKALDFAVGTLDTHHEFEVMDLIANLEIGDDGSCYSPSTNGSQANKFIELAGISTIKQPLSDYVKADSQWFAAIGDICDDDTVGQRGPTALIAANRAYVAHYLGEEIEIPDELAPEESVGVRCPKDEPVFAVSIQGGLATMENGTQVDLLKIQAACNAAFQETGEADLMSACDEMSKLTGQCLGPSGEWLYN